MRLPLIPTLLVAAAVAAMVALGVWQLGRAEEKDALAEIHRRNAGLPLFALPAAGKLDEALFYRKAGAFCLEVVAWKQAGGRSAGGRTGTRHLAECRTGAEGPGFVADMGVSADPKARPSWKGGDVVGILVPEPGSAGLLARLAGRAPARAMIVAHAPAPGLEPSAPPEPASSNNSLAYAFQWFFFAAVAAIIYVLALRSRRRRETLPPGA